MGLGAVCVLSALAGIINMTGGYGAISLGGWTVASYVVPFGITPVSGSFSNAGAVLIVGLGAMILGIAQIVFAFGAWNLSDWAWLLRIGLAAVGVVVTIFSVLTGIATLATPVMLVLVPVLVGVYLLLPGIRGAFGLESTRSAPE